MKKKMSNKAKKFIKKARMRVRECEILYLWLAENKKIRKKLEIPLSKFKKVR